MPRAIQVTQGHKAIENAVLRYLLIPHFNKPIVFHQIDYGRAGDTGQVKTQDLYRIDLHGNKVLVPAGCEFRTLNLKGLIGSQETINQDLVSIECDGVVIRKEQETDKQWETVALWVKFVGENSFSLLWKRDTLYPIHFPQLLHLLQPTGFVGGLFFLNCADMSMLYSPHEIGDFQDI
jgi:hypothetical protein